MDHQYQPGERAEIIIGNRWHSCRVLQVIEEPHHSGETIECFTIQFPDETIMKCGRNSLRVKK